MKSNDYRYKVLNFVNKGMRLEGQVAIKDWETALKMHHHPNVLR
jgi:hypothetical protein